MSKTFNLTINGQGSYIASERIPVAGTTGYYFVHPIFSEEWSTADRIIIAFVWAKCAKYGAPHTVKVGVEWNMADDVKIPQSVLAHEGTLTIGAIGLSADGMVVMTTAAVEGSIEVIDAVAETTTELNGDSEDDPDIWTDLQNRMDAVEEAVEGKQDALEAGEGLNLSDDVLSLQKASAEALGGIKVGSYLTIDTDGTLNVRLYSETGQNTDGAMTQKAVTDEINNAKERLTDLEDQIDALASDLTYKGSVPTQDDLPADATVGDVYTAADTGVLYVWDGEKWVALNDSSGGIPTDATFWGASYDEANNSVNETSVLTLKNSGTTYTEQLQLRSSLGYVMGGLGTNLSGEGGIFILSRLNNHYTRTVWSDGLITFAGLNNWQAHSTYGLNVSNARIHNVADPEASQDAATKNYVDTHAGGVTAFPAALFNEILENA